MRVLARGFSMLLHADGRRGGADMAAARRPLSYVVATRRAALLY